MGSREYNSLKHDATMPPKSLPKPNIQTCPPGLLAIVDLISRVPARASDLLEYEVIRRKRELIRTQEARALLSWHPWETMRLLVLSGAVAFFLAWFFSAIAELGRFYNSIVSATHIQVPFIDQRLIDLLGLVPKSSFRLFSSIPDFGALEAFYEALGVMALLAFTKLVFISIHWKKIKLLGDAERELGEELKELERWKEDFSAAKMKTQA